MLRQTVSAEDTARVLHAGGDTQHGMGQVSESIAHRTAEPLAQELARERERRVAVEQQRKELEQ